MEAASKIIVLSIRNCELHCCHLDGFQRSKKGIFAMAEIECFFAAKSSSSKFRIWHNIVKTHLDKERIDKMSESIWRLKSKIVKLAIIGTGYLQRTRIERKLKAYEG